MRVVDPVSSIHLRLSKNERDEFSNQLNQIESSLIEIEVIVIFESCGDLISSWGRDNLIMEFG